MEPVEPQEMQSREEKPVVIPEFRFEPYRVPKRKKALYIAAAVVIGLGLLACLAYFCIIISVIIKTNREQANSAESMARSDCIVTDNNYVYNLPYESKW